MKYKFLNTLVTLLLCFHVFSQAKGNLFIIGGGHKSAALMQQLISTAQLNANDYIAILPMATEEPDTAYYYIKEDFKTVCNNPIINLNFTVNDTHKTSWLDSVQNAKLIFITGGDQPFYKNCFAYTHTNGYSTGI